MHLQTGRTMLHIACEYGHRAIVKMLLDDPRGVSVVNTPAMVS